MIAYNRTSLDNLSIQQQAAGAFNKGLITPEEYTRIREGHPYNLYMPNLFIRIGLFLLTFFAAVCVIGLFLLGGVGGEKNIGVLLIVLGVLEFAVLEIFIHARHTCGAGVDDALLIVGCLQVVVGVNLCAGNIAPQTQSLLVFLVALFGVVRYANHLMALVAYGALLSLIFYSFTAYGGPVGKALLPFLVIAVSWGLYLLFTRLSLLNRLRHYHSCLVLLRPVALLSLYLAGNYYIVDSLNAVVSGKPMRLGWLWWMVTAVVPLVYIAKGIQKKDRMFLWVGMLLTGASIGTFRFYYHILPVQLALIIAGSLLLAAAFGLIHILRTPRRGFMSAAADDPHPLEGLPVEGLILAESAMSLGAQPAADSDFHFGGGSGGGGGAGGQF